jgi:hypothetical protein
VCLEIERSTRNWRRNVCRNLLTLECPTVVLAMSDRAYREILRDARTLPLTLGSDFLVLPPSEFDALLSAVDALVLNYQRPSIPSGVS